MIPEVIEQRVETLEKWQEDMNEWKDRIDKDISDSKILLSKFGNMESDFKEMKRENRATLLLTLGWIVSWLIFHH
jgi:hypothetical protein